MFKVLEESSYSHFNDIFCERNSWQNYYNLRNNFPPMEIYPTRGFNIRKCSFVSLKIDTIDIIPL